MRSMFEIMGLVTDGKINTKEDAAALVDAEAAEIAEAGQIPVEEARKILLSNIGYCTGYYGSGAADRIMDLFETEHPIFGKTHPTADEALRIELEYANRRKENDGI